MTIRSAFRRLKTLKRLVMISWIFATFVIASGVISSYYFFTERATLSTEVSSFSKEIRDIQYIRSLSQAYLSMSSEDTSKSNSEIGSQGSIRLLETIEVQPLTREIASDLDFESLPANQRPLAVLELLARLDAHTMATTNSTALATRNMTDITLALMGASLLTLLFGLILPYLLTRKLLELAQTVRHQVSHTVAETVAEWVKAQQRFGDEAFKNPQFWMQVSSLALEAYAPYIDSPNARILSDLVTAVRDEIQKIEPKKSENTQSDSRPQLKIA